MYIKPLSTGTTYKQMADLLDEMNITAQRRYSLGNPTAADRQLLAARR